MSDSAPTTDATHRTTTATDETPWQRLADADPIEIRDPLAELLGMVPEGEPLVVTFADVAKAAGHACPAVAGAYRSTQLALDELYPESTPVRSEISVVVGGERDDHGLGPMANAVRHVTGAAGEAGFAGLAGCGGRQDLMSFGEVPGPGRSFEFTREDTGEAVRVSFDPSATAADPDEGGRSPMQAAASIVQGEASEADRERFHEQWHGRVQRVLDARPSEERSFTVTRPGDS
jgi:formylmethanofuran dehydrogenase subunit E